MKKIFFIINICLTLLISSIFILKLNSDRNQIDYLNKSLSSVKKILTNHSNISLLSQDENYWELYYQTQLALVPNIVEKQNIDNDTILIIEKNKEIKIDTLSCKYYVLVRDSNSFYNIVLCSKKRLK